jgi:transcriptional repressor NrdR
LRCPYCRQDNDKVIDSRAAGDGFAIRRRRQCIACNRRYTTYERIENTPLRVIKKDGQRVSFEREKIYRGIQKAAEKRPISPEQIENATAKIEREIHEMFDREVKSSYIGELVMRELRALDAVAFVRFASVFRAYKDLREFTGEINRLLEENGNKSGNPQENVKKKTRN